MAPHTYTRLSEILQHFDNPTQSKQQNIDDVIDILTHVVHARDGMISASELIDKLQDKFGIELVKDVA